MSILRINKSLTSFSKKAATCWLIIALSLSSSGWVLPTQSPRSEYQLKAVFLFNFAQFVEWPHQAFPQPQSPLVIGIFGEDPFHDLLDEIVKGEVVNGHPLIVKRYTNIEEAPACHILFINIADQDKLKQVLATVKGRSTLTVSDRPEFIRLGGMIRLLTERNRIRFAINPEASKAAGLTISSKLLNLAEIAAQ